MTSLAPRAASRHAISAPIPALPPVTSARFPSILMVASRRGCRCWRRLFPFGETAIVSLEERVKRAVYGYLRPV
nr:hypothetical protein [Methylocapsa acidiphila]